MNTFLVNHESTETEAKDAEAFPSRYRQIAFWAFAVCFFIAPFFPQLTYPDAAFAFRSLIFLTLALCLARLGVTAALREAASTPLFWPVLLTLAWTAIGLSYTPGLYQAQNHFTVMLCLALLFLVLRVTSFSDREFDGLAFALAAGACGASLLSLYTQWVGHEGLIEAIRESAVYDDVMRQELIDSLEANRALGRFGNPNHLAGYLVLGLWCVWRLAYRSRTWNARLGCALMAAILLVGVYQTFSRSGLLAAGLALALMGGYELHRRGWRIAWGWIFGGLIALASVMIALLALLPFELLGGRLMTVATIIARVHFFRGALAIIQDHPWLGVGPEGFEGFYSTFLRPGDIEARYVHNIFLERAVEGGAVALFLFLWALIVVALWGRQLWRRKPASRMAVMAAIGAGACLLLLAMVDFHNRLIEMWLAPLLLLCAALPRRQLKAPNQFTAQWPLTVALVTLLAVWLMLVACRYGNQLAREEGYALSLAERPYEARQAYQRAVWFDRTDAESWRRLAWSWQSGQTPVARLNWLHCLERARAWAPRRASIRADYAEALYALGYPELALHEMRTALKLFPARPQNHERAARLYQAMNRTEEAKEAEETARRLQQLIEELRP